MGKAYFTEKYTELKNIFCRTQKSSIKCFIICIITFKIRKV